MSYNLFIDDVLDPHEVIWGSTEEKRLYKEQEWIVARNWPEVCEIVLSLGFPKMISFDHDMGEFSTSSGLDIAQQLIRLSLDSPDGYGIPQGFEYKIHTQDAKGSEIIRFLMNGVKHTSANSRSLTDQPDCVH
jgi:hypothetical protein